MTSRLSALAAVALMAVAALLAGCSGDAPAQAQDAAQAPGGTAPERAKATGPHVTEVFAQEQTAGGVVEISRPVVHVTVYARGRFPVDAHYEIDGTEAPAGSIINVTLINEDPSPTFFSWSRHGWFLQGIPDSSPGTPASGQTMSTEFVTPDEPGTYTYYCTVAYNRERGMEGTFTLT